MRMPAARRDGFRQMLARPKENPADCSAGFAWTNDPDLESELDAGCQDVEVLANLLTGTIQTVNRDH